VVNPARRPPAHAGRACGGGAAATTDPGRRRLPGPPRE
jgi:hypothetical protein